RSQLAKCFSVGKRLTSTPISPKITRAVPTSIPSIKVRSTPKAWNNGPVASNRTSLLLRPLFRGLTLCVFSPPQLGQFDRIAFALQDGADDQHAGHSRDVADDLRQFDIDLLHGLLHVLGMTGGVAHLHLPLP